MLRVLCDDTIFLRNDTNTKTTHNHIIMILSVIGSTSLWMIVIWAALLVFFSPVLFVVSVCLPELPLLLIRRLHYVQFDAV